MTRAGFCRSCGTNVWLRDDGSGACGHTAADIEGVYEATVAGQAGVGDEPETQGASAAADQAVEPVATPAPLPVEIANQGTESHGTRSWAALATLAAVVLALLVAAAAFVTRPQMVVTRLVTDGAVEQGESDQAVATVENQGKRAGRMDLVLVLNGEEVGRAEAVVEPGVQKDIPIEFTVDEGPGDYVLVARGFDIAESVRVLKPAAFEIASVTVEPKTFHAGIDETGICMAAVDNVGEAPGEFDVEFALDGEVAGSVTVRVDGGSQNEARLEFGVPGIGNHILTANGVRAGFAVHGTKRPAHGTVVLNKLKGGRNRIKMINNWPTDVLVVVAQPGDRKPALLAVYLRSRSSQTISGVKDGTYQVYYSFGSDWCPTCRVFAGDRYYGRFQGVDKLTSSRSMYTQLTLTFGAEKGPGVPTEDVSQDEFPKM